MSTPGTNPGDNRVDNPSFKQLNTAFQSALTQLEEQFPGSSTDAMKTFTQFCGQLAFVEAGIEKGTYKLPVDAGDPKNTGIEEFGRMMSSPAMTEMFGYAGMQIPDSGLINSSSLALREGSDMPASKSHHPPEGANNPKADYTLILFALADSVAKNEGISGFSSADFKTQIYTESQQGIDSEDFSTIVQNMAKALES